MRRAGLVLAIAALGVSGCGLRVPFIGADRSAESASAASGPSAHAAHADPDRAAAGLHDLRPSTGLYAAPAPRAVRAPERIETPPAAPGPFDAPPAAAPAPIPAPTPVTVPSAAHADVPDAHSVLYALHVASYRSRDTAARGWAELIRQNPDALRGLTARLSPVTTGDGDFLRLKAGPVASQAEASARCAALMAAGAYCRPIGFDGDPLSVTASPHGSDSP